MHYFKRNIGDYHKKAGRLSMVEHGAYTLLMDACYDREQFPTEAEAIDWCWARNSEEIAAVRFVLSRFFTLIDGRYVQQRISDEIAAFHEKAEKNKQIALEREAKRRALRGQVNNDSLSEEHETCSADHDSCTSGHQTNNHKPLTNNQEPITKNIKTPLPPSGGDGVQEVFTHWQTVMGEEKSKLTKGRAEKIKARLRDGYSPEDLKQAIDGCRKSDYHMGRNDGGKVYNCLTLICRSAEKLEQFMGYAKAQKTPDKHGGFENRGYAEDATPEENIAWLQ